MKKYLYNDLYNLEEVHWWHKAKRKLVISFFKKYLSKKNSRILDVGCGTGKNLAAFSRFGNVSGIDNSSDAIAFCKKRGFVKVKKGSIEKIPYRNSSFDVVTALDVLEHVDDVKALEEINAVLNKDGILVITVPAFRWLWSKWDEVLYHKRRYTEKSISKILKDSGFQIITISYVYSFLVLPTLIIRGIKKTLYKNYYPSDFQLSNKILNKILSIAANIERIVILNYKIPFGTSLVVIARKDNK